MEKKDVFKFLHLKHFGLGPLYSLQLQKNKLMGDCTPYPATSSYKLFITKIIITPDNAVVEKQPHKPQNKDVVILML